MRRDTVDELRCPYSGGPLTVSSVAEGNADHIDYGIVRSECFEFPIVGGILLLSLAKSYGGPEEKLTPHAALLIAALHHLADQDVDGLNAWIGRHAPLAANLMANGYRNYEDFASDLEDILAPAVSAELVRAADLEVIGDIGLRHALAKRSRMSPRSRPVRWAHRIVDRVRAVRAQLGSTLHGEKRREERLHSYYMQRFFSVRAASTSLGVSALPTSGRILSVCPGHGVFENILRASDRLPTSLVCMDGQFVNLLVIRHLIGVDADFICHDVQFAWPFRDGFFDGVFSSTCLPELPPQKHVVEESVRVTAPTGWTLFDSIWALDSGAHRIDPYRYYRYSQNFFDSIDRYPDFFGRTVTDRSTYFDISGAPSRYVEGTTWLREREDIDRALDEARDVEINALILDESRFSGFVADPVSARAALIDPAQLSVSPAFEAHITAGRLELIRKASYAQPDINFASRDFGVLDARASITASQLSDPAALLDFYLRGILVPLPPRFSARDRTVQSFAIRIRATSPAR